MAETIQAKIQKLTDNESQRYAQEALTYFTAAAKLNEDNQLGKDIVDVDSLSPKEIILWRLPYSRSTRPTIQTRENALAGIYTRHMIESALALLTAKKQIHGDYVGTEGKQQGIVGIFGPHAAFFGLGDDYRNSYISTGGSMQNWIHSGSTQLGGSAGNDVIFGYNVVHCIMGLALYSEEVARTVHIQERINTAPQPVVTVQEQMRNANNNEPWHIREFDTARILGNATQLRLQVLAGATVPASEFGMPICITYTTANILQENDLGAKTASQLNNLNLLNTT
nr:hypothetical protein [uncultured Nitrososphaera sp.]